MLRWILYGALVILLGFVAVLSVAALAVDPRREYAGCSRFYRGIVNCVAQLLMWVLRINVEVTGRESLPQGRYLLVANHRSNFDPLVKLAALPEQTLVFISKPENFKIPIVGRIIHRCGFLPIDRENARNAIVTIRRAAQFMQEDAASVGVYPEGTRSKSCALLPFHSGVLKAAQHADVPVVVMAVRGTERICKNAPLRRTLVQLDVVRVIPAETVRQSRSTALGDEIYQMLDAFLQQET